MKTAILQRELTSDQGTPGRITFGDKVRYTQELPFRDLDGNGIGDSQFSCITPGTYEMEWHESPSKGWCYRLKGVVGRSEILMHRANLAGDSKKGYIAELLGCIALGVGRAVFTDYHDKQIKPQQGITSSKQACDEFYAWGNKEPVTLIVKAA